MLIRKKLKCKRQQRVSSKNCGGFTKNLMVAGFTPPEIIVVESGKVVMNERVGVNHFKDTGDTKIFFYIKIQALSGC